MNRAEFIAVLENPKAIDAHQTAELYQLLSDYPYCATLQSLYVKGLQNAGSFDFDKQLPQTALMVADRVKLYELYYQKQLQEILHSVQEVEEHQQEAFSDAVVEVSEEDTAVEKVEQEADSSKVKDELLKELETNILLEAINQSLAKDIDEEVQLLDAQHTTDIDAHSPDLASAPTLDEVAEEKQFVEISAPKKFSDWLQVMLPVNNSTDETNNIPDEPKKTHKALANPQALIDRFLQLEDTSIKVKKEPATPQDIARLSLVENEEFVTETLANIYATQHNYAKSIKIYEQLILKFPEKKTFFASRIRFLREKMEYDK